MGIEQQWTRRLLPRLLVPPLPQGLLVTRGRQPRQLLACQVEGGTGQAGVTEPWLEQHSVLFLVTMVDPARRRRRKTRGLAQGRRRRRRRRREAGLSQEARPAALDPTPTDLTLSATAVHLSHTRTVLCCNVFEFRVLAIFVKFCLWPQS